MYPYKPPMGPMVRISDELVGDVTGHDVVQVGNLLVGRQLQPEYLVEVVWC